MQHSVNGSVVVYLTYLPIGRFHQQCGMWFDLSIGVRQFLSWKISFLTSALCFPYDSSFISRNVRNFSSTKTVVKSKKQNVVDQQKASNLSVSSSKIVPILFIFFHVVGVTDTIALSF